MKGIFIDHAQTGMALKLCNATGLEGLLDSGIGGIRKHYVAPFLQLKGTLYGWEIHLASNVFCTLAPLQFKNLYAQLFDDVFRYAQLGIFHIGLDDDPACAIIPFLIGIDPALHLRGSGYSSVTEFRLWVHTADVFARYHNHSGYGCADSHFCPVDPGNISRPDRTSKHRKVQLDASVSTKRRGGIHSRKGGLVRIGLDPHSPNCRTLNIEMGKVHRVILFRAGCNFSKGDGIDDLSSFECRTPDFTRPFTSVHTGHTDAGDGCRVHPRSRQGSCTSIRFAE